MHLLTGLVLTIACSIPLTRVLVAPWYSTLMLRLALLITLLPIQALADVTGPARVIDGDTIEVAPSGSASMV